MITTPLSQYGSGGGNITLPAGMGGQVSSAPAAGFSLSSLFPSNLGQYAPQPYQSFGGVPVAQAAQVNPANVNPMISQYSSLLGTELAPYFQQQTLASNADQGMRGIFNSSAGSYLNNQLLGQQASALASGISPLVQQGMGYAQQDVSQNAANQQQSNLANAAMYGGITSQNQADYNNYLNELFGAGMGLGNTELGSYLGSFGASPGAMGILGSGANSYGNVYGSALGGSGAFGTALGGALASMFGHGYGTPGAPQTGGPGGNVPSTTPS